MTNVDNNTMMEHCQGTDEKYRRFWISSVIDPVAELEEGYGLPNARVIRTLSGGMFAAPLLVETDGRRLVLRPHSFRNTSGSFQFQSEVIGHAAAAGHPCPRVLRRLDGTWGRRVGHVFWALYEYVDGATMPWTAWADAKRTPAGRLETVAGMAANLHDLFRRWETIPAGSALRTALPPIQFRHLAACARHAIGAANAAAAEQDRLPKTVGALADPAIPDAWGRLVEEAQGLGVRRLPRQIVHGDLSPVNLVWTSHRPEPYWIDWDCVHVGHRLYDALGDVLLRVDSSEAADARVDPDEISRYVEAYSGASNDPLGVRERACVAMFLVARQLEDLRQRCAVVATLPAERDAEYANLIRMRLSLIEQLRQYSPWKGGTAPWM